MIPDETLGRFSEVWQFDRNWLGTKVQRLAVINVLKMEFGSPQHRAMQQLDKSANRVYQRSFLVVGIMPDSMWPDYMLAVAGASGMSLRASLAPAGITTIVPHELGHVFDQHLLTHDEKEQYMISKGGTALSAWNEYNEMFADSVRDWWFDPASDPWMTETLTRDHFIVVPATAPIPLLPTIQVEYLDRKAWGARTDLPRLGYDVDPSKRTEVHIHHTTGVDAGGTPNRWSRAGAIGYHRRLQTMRPDLGLDVPYSEAYYVLEDLTVLRMEGRGLFRSGAHTANHNTAGFGLAFAGNAQIADPKAIAAFLAVIKNEVSYMKSSQFPNLTKNKNPKGWDLWGHQDTKSTSCPGAYIYPELARIDIP